MQCGQPFGGIVEAGDESEGDSSVVDKCFLAGHGDFFEGFQAIGDESRADDGTVGDPLGWEGLEESFGVGFQPFLRTKTGLECHGPLIFVQGDGLGDQVGGAGTMVVIGIPCVDDALGETVK